MDILHENHLDGFCIVSSDSDFTRLATRIREAGLVVYGFGEEKTPESFTSACDKFIFTENLRKRENSKKTKYDEKKLKEIMVKAINAVSADDGWATLSSVASYISKSIPSFDPRSYGYDKYGKLIKSLNYIEIDNRAFQDGSTNVHIYIKIKEN
jgi:hypothetical protein